MGGRWKLGATTLTLLMAAMAVLPVHGQQEGGSSPATTFRAGVNLVSVPVTVQGKGGEFVKGLRREQFHVFERGVEQPVAVFGAGDVPVDLALLIDTSGSMGAQLSSAQHAARVLVQSLGAEDRAAVVSFGGRIRHLATLTSDRAVVMNAIGHLAASGSTPLYDAVYVAVKEFGESGTDAGLRRRALVVLSDGEDTTSLVPFDSLLEAARQMGVATYVVVVRSADTPKNTRTSFADYEMKTLARETGARAFFPRPDENLDTVYGSIAGELASQYTLGFVPAPATPHNFVRFTVTVDQPQTVVRARTGYVTGG